MVFYLLNLFEKNTDIRFIGLTLRTSFKKLMQSLDICSGIVNFPEIIFS